MDHRSHLSPVAVLIGLTLTCGCGSDREGFPSSPGGAGGADAGSGHDGSPGGAGGGAIKTEAGPEAGSAGSTLDKTHTLSRFGITWEFDSSYPYGEFVNGDPWVLGPITVIAISQSSEMPERDGSMVNPLPGTHHGYDGRVGGYDPLLDVSRQLPVLRIDPNASLVSTISRVPEVTDRPERRPALEVAAVLTVLDVEPPPGSFRPPYAGTEKPLYSRVALRTDRLLALAPVESTPPLTEMEALFEKPWIDNVLEWQGDDLHPRQNMPNYGGGISRDVGDGALRLLIDEPLAQRDLLLIRYIQLGIDNFGLVNHGGNWGNVGGTIGVGRKLPILFAGLLLNDADMQNVALDFDTRHLFQEDGQTFYLTQDERDGTYHPANCSGSSDYCHPGYYDAIPLGTPSWGERHYRWRTTSYNYLPGKIAYLSLTHASTTGAALVVRLLGMESMWNHDPFLDWTDKCRTEGVTGTWGSTFSRDMWEAYR